MKKSEWRTEQTACPQRPSSARFVRASRLRVVGPRSLHRVFYTPARLGGTGLDSTLNLGYMWCLHAALWASNKQLLIRPRRVHFFPITPPPLPSLHRQYLFVRDGWIRSTRPKAYIFADPYPSPSPQDFFNSSFVLFEGSTAVCASARRLTCW